MHCTTTRSFEFSINSLQGIKMKKSILATLFAGLFTLGAVAGDDSRMMKIEMKAESGSPTVINIDNGEGAQVFEFTKEELQDKQLVEDRLMHLDDDTRDAVLGALNGIHMDGDNMVFIKEDIDVGDHNKMVVIKKSGDVGIDVDHDFIVDGNGSHSIHKLREIISKKMGDKIVIKMDDGMKLHHKGGHAAHMIEKLLNSSDLTQEQLDQIQQALDAKR